MKTTAKLSPYKKTEVVALDDGQKTTFHYVKYPIDFFRPRIIKFNSPTRLLDWCQQNNVPEAINGGFFIRNDEVVLGELWLNALKEPSVTFHRPWHKVRGAMHINQSGFLSIDFRHKLPKTPDDSLMQAGPMLVSDGQIIIGDDDKEGFTAGQHQFDTDITVGRYPRAAIGITDDSILAVACDGRSNKDAGMTLHELATKMQQLGCIHALNLDGGSSSSLVSDCKLLNTSRSDDETFTRGRHIHTAIVFEPR